MQLQHIFAACQLVQPINVLGDDGSQLALLFQLGQPQMRGVGPGTGHDQLFAVKIIKFFGFFLKKGMAQNFLRRVFVLLVIQPVHAAKIRNAAFGRNACSAEKHDIAAFLDQLFQLLLFIFHGGFLPCILSFIVAHSGGKIKGGIRFCNLP